MQKVAAYLLERTEDLQTPGARKAEGDRIRKVIEAWLRSKGAASVERAGTYAAVDGSDASYRVTTASDGDRSWTMFELTEVTKEGRRFVTTVSVTVGNKHVVVFVTMEVGSVSTLITRIDVDPRCPKVVRELLEQPGPWHHGASRLRVLSVVSGFDAGQSLAQEIQNVSRTIPFVVVSTIAGQTALPKLDAKLASDLAGVANVYTVDEDASWALTDTLRKPFSCYGGAVRVYWPRLSSQDEPYRHQLWTAARLQGLEDDEQFALDRIRRQVRTVIMRASAASVVRPVEIDDIRGAAARAEYATLKANANSLDDFKALADSYAADNDTLRRDLAARDKELEQFRGEVQRLEAEKRALLYHLGQANAHSEDGAEVEPDRPEDDDGAQPPTRGDVRFYKKRYDTPTHDVLVRVADCGHNSWQSSARADKARKGLIRLEGGTREWRVMQHCGTCTGGGMWRVQW
ncbi:hypothetical protein [Polyangium sp. 6x1]|uniref:hypothetical protein n=1 Tax=Polyangium sp. 6x1 TaxID=3042689 RepID=UPI0024821849|nr:hypothetical protein [Polyangium sp. 6x1]MDI1452188.1 hypothetical protein [Polyangium sp. 6x1]